MRDRLLLAISMSLLVLSGCPPEPGGETTGTSGSTDATVPVLVSVDMADQPRPLPDKVVTLTAARNETVSFALQLLWPANVAASTADLSLAAPEGSGGRIDLSQYSVYQALPMSVDMGQAGYVRHSGNSAESGLLPRALLPLKCANGRIDLGQLRDPGQPLDPRGHANGAATIWIDLSVPADAPSGDYRTTCTLRAGDRVVGAIPVQLTVWDFSLPAAPNLHLVSRLDWSALLRLFPDQFQTVTPELMSRGDSRYAAAVTTLDQLVALAQQHRAAVVVGRLQPQVKWPAAAPPQVDWEFFDSVAAPWLDGSAFPDGVGLGFWPLPTLDYLDRYDERSRMLYWRAAAEHFDKEKWLARTALCPPDADAHLADELPVFLSLYPHLRVRVAMQDPELDVHDPAGAGRVMAAAPGLVFRGVPQTPLVAGMRSAHWLRADHNGPGQSFGSGANENDVRVWAWLAFLRRAELIDWGDALPAQTDPGQMADPDQMTWFYPGQWFGVDRPLPTVQLKWLRRAEQDYEYLRLAKEHGELANALVMARLLTKPVQLPPGQLADPADGLLCGTADASAWSQARELLARAILLGAASGHPDASKQIDLNVATTHWIAPQEKPMLMARDARWTLRPGGAGVDLDLGVDVYNAADQALPGRLQWNAAAEGWQFRPQPIEIAGVQAIDTYQLQRLTMQAAFDPSGLTTAAEQPMQLSFTDALNGRTYPLRLVLPVALSQRREGPLTIDGILDDWGAGDALHDNTPLVRMFDRPTLQRQELGYATTNSSLYSCWAAHAFYVAFKLDGLRGEASGEVHKETNFISYQFGRAWNEDLCEIILQAVYADGAAGPLVHIVAKPHGQLVLESKAAEGWQALPAGDARYGSTIDGPIWRGEMALPWEIINDRAHQGQTPTLLRFNFAQHQQATGQTASWAGPVDCARDDIFMGLLVLRGGR